MLVFVLSLVSIGLFGIIAISMSPDLQTLLGMSGTDNVNMLLYGLLFSGVAIVVSFVVNLIWDICNHTSTVTYAVYGTVTYKRHYPRYVVEDEKIIYSADTGLETVRTRTEAPDVYRLYLKFDQGSIDSTTVGPGVFSRCQVGDRVKVHISYGRLDGARFIRYVEC